jgi:asparagine synthase (glutamine-hydrolysing)
MCGITGYLSQHSALSNYPDLPAMTRVITHRGPDEDGFYTDARVGLGMRRLSIIDLSTGKQPISNETNTIHVVFNGEIYNYCELRDQLLARGHVFRTHSDTECIVHGYEEWGADVANHLRGMFAFALWDSARERLLIARDHFGIKPLFYTQVDGILLFGSEIKSLLLHPLVKREIDLVSLDKYLSFLYIPAPRTIFKNIFELPPGHFLIAESGNLTVQRYYQPKLYTASAMTEQAAIEKIRAAFEDSVRAMLVSDVPLGAFLSGGIDSSSIVAMMKRHTNQSVKTFSIGFGEREKNWDEIEAAKQVSEFYGTEHRSFRVTPNIVELLPQVVWHFDQPFANPTAVLMMLLSRETRQHVTVALAGTGGDELFAGYPRYLGMQAFQYYRGLPQAIRSGIAKVTDSVLRDSTNGNLWAQRARRFFDGGAMPFDDCYMRWLVCIEQQRKRELYGESMRNALTNVDTFDFIRPLLQSSSDESLTLTDFQTYLPFNQLHYADRMSMAASLEVRVPFVDQQLFETIQDVSLQLKLSGRTTKGLFRKAMAPFLPPEILHAPKLGLNAPVAMWFRNELKDWVHNLLSPDVIRARGYFEPEPIQRIISEQEVGTRDHSLFIWALLVFEVWHQKYLD